MKAHTATGRYRKGRNSTRRTAHACGGTEHCHRRSRSQKKRRVFSWGRTRDMAKGCRSKGKTGNQERENLATRMRGEGLHLRVLQTRAPKLVIFPPDYDAASSPLHAPPRMLRPRCADPRGKRGDQPTFFFRDQQNNPQPSPTRNQPTPPPTRKEKTREKEGRERGTTATFFCQPTEPERGTQHANKRG